LQKAVELGYEIQYIYEVWYFDQTCEGLFQDYVNTWLKIKQEASGWPQWVGDDETKRQQYIREYYEHEGIQMEYDKIEHNPGPRALAKMMLNSMWGKFGQRLNKTQFKSKNLTTPKPFTVSWIPIPWMCVTCPSSTNKWWKCTISIKTKTSRVSQPQRLRGLFHHLLGT